VCVRSLSKKRPACNAYATVSLSFSLFRGLTYPFCTHISVFLHPPIRFCLTERVSPIVCALVTGSACCPNEQSFLRAVLHLVLSYPFVVGPSGESNLSRDQREQHFCERVCVRTGKNPKIWCPTTCPDLTDPDASGSLSCRHGLGTVPPGGWISIYS